MAGQLGLLTGLWIFWQESPSSCLSHPGTSHGYHSQPGIKYCVLHLFQTTGWGQDRYQYCAGHFCGAKFLCFKNELICPSLNWQHPAIWNPALISNYAWNSKYSQLCWFHNGLKTVNIVKIKNNCQYYLPYSKFQSLNT